MSLRSVGAKRWVFMDKMPIVGSTDGPTAASIVDDGALIGSVPCPQTQGMSDAGPVFRGAEETTDLIGSMWHARADAQVQAKGKTADVQKRTLV